MRRTYVDDGLRKYLHRISRFPLLTPQQEIALAKKITGGDTNARNEMIQSYLRLVVSIAQDYVNLGLPLADLISEGTIGLTKAVERFDPAKGAKLSPYAALWIKQSITTALEVAGFAAVTAEHKHLRYEQNMQEWLNVVRRRRRYLAADGDLRCDLFRRATPIWGGARRRKRSVSPDHLCLVAIRAERPPEVG